jgi:hypothetical protein
MLWRMMFSLFIRTFLVIVVMFSLFINLFIKTYLSN